MYELDIWRRSRWWDQSFSERIPEVVLSFRKHPIMIPLSVLRICVWWETLAVGWISRSVNEMSICCIMLGYSRPTDSPHRGGPPTTIHGRTRPSNLAGTGKEDHQVRYLIYWLLIGLHLSSLNGNFSSLVDSLPSFVGNLLSLIENFPSIL